MPYRMFLVSVALRGLRVRGSLDLNNITVAIKFAKSADMDDACTNQCQLVVGFEAVCRRRGCQTLQ